MKKLILRDLKIRNHIAKTENKNYVLKCIFKNFNFFIMIRWNAFLRSSLLQKHHSRVAMVNRCLQSINKKRFNKLTTFSRHIFLKLIREGAIPGIQKANW